MDNPDKCYNKMKLYTERHTVKVTPTQKDTLQKLRHKYKVDVSDFIRKAIDEKIRKDWEFLKQKVSNCPF